MVLVSVLSSKNLIRDKRKPCRETGGAFLFGFYGVLLAHDNFLHLEL